MAEIRYWRAGRLNSPRGPGKGLDTRAGFGVLVGKREAMQWIELTEDQALEAAEQLIEAVQFNRRQAAQEESSEVES